MTCDLNVVGRATGGRMTRKTGHCRAEPARCHSDQRLAADKSAKVGENVLILTPRV